MSAAELIEPIDADGRTLAKGSLVRGWLQVLVADQLLDAVVARSVPEVVSLLKEPPVSSAWVDVAHLECIAQAVLLEVGEARILDLTVRSHRVGLVALLSRWLGGIIRVFGPSPHTVLQHAQAAAKANTVGFSMSWINLGDKHGVLEAHYPFRSRIHAGGAWATSVACTLAGEAV